MASGKSTGSSTNNNSSNGVERQNNEIRLNNQQLLTVRGDTVATDNLMEEETATNRAGAKIVGEYKGAPYDEAYLISDPIGSIEEEDYVPFNDISDAEQPKKKVLFADMIEKLRTEFPSAVSPNGISEIGLTDEVLYLKNNQIDASMTDNNVSKITYPSTSTILDRKGRTIMRTEAYVDPNGEIGWKSYVNNFDTDGHLVAEKGMRYHMKKSGELYYVISDPRAFRKAIDNIDQLGTSLPRGTVIDDYHTDSYTGTYYFADDGVASQITTLPESLCGKLIVMNNGNGGFSQYYIPNHSVKIWVRVWWSGAWSAWANIASGSKPHTYEPAIRYITGTADLNDYTEAGIYQCDRTKVTSLANCPVTSSFKLIVDKAYNNSSSEITQRITCQNATETVDWFRTRQYNQSTWGEWVHLPYIKDKTWGNNSGVETMFRGKSDKRGLIQFNNVADHLVHNYNNGSAWGSAKTLANQDDIIPPTIGGGFAEAVINGSTITATISGFKLVEGGIVSLYFPSEVMSNCTLNISNTGAKYIRLWSGANVSSGSVLRPSMVHTFMYDGTYYRLISSAMTPVLGLQNYVADTSGNILLDWGYDVNRAQLKYGIGTNKLAWNYYKNSAWRGDVTVADYYDIVHQTLGVTIPDNADLNNYTSNGIYNIASTNRAKTISNMPCLLAGKLIVQRIAANQYIKQIFIVYDSDERYKGIYERAYNGDGSGAWRDWRRFVESNDGKIELYQETTTAEDKYAGISARILDTDTQNSYARDMLKVYQDHQATPYGFNLILDSGGNTFVGGGEGSDSLYPLKKGDAGENLYLTADGNIFLEANTQTIANRQGFRVDTNGAIIPVKAEALTDNFGAIGESSHKLANLWVYKINGSTPPTSDELNTTIAKVGKSILPSWSMTSNVYTNNGITYTFNPSTGEITANGTASNYSVCIIAGKDYSQYWIPKGTYTLSGCPSGGSGSTYHLQLDLASGSKSDYGSGNTFTLTSDQKSTNNEHLYIRIESGQTVSNIVFKPMLRPAWTSADYEPCEDIYKGNCYVGTCTTAAGTKDKVAYVDGYFVLRKGVRVAIKFSNTNTYSSSTSNPVTLNVNGTGAKYIYHNTTHSGAGNTGTYTRLYGVANRYIFYIYDGTYWVWDSYSCDDNSTNFLRNDASSTLTASAPQLRLKNSDINAQASDNGISTTKYSEYQTRDKNDLILSDYFTEISNYGKIGIFMQVRNYNGSTSAVGMGNFGFRMDKSGNVTYQVDAANNFNAATGMGYGTCSTAADQQIKVVTLANFVLSVGATVNVRFTNTNSFNSQTSTPIQLNVNNTGAKNIWYGNTHSGAGNTGTNTRIYGEANRVFTYMYDGTYWVWLNCGYEADTVDPRSLGFGYGTCDTAEATTAKVVSLTNYTLRTGGYVTVWFKYNVPASATMNINSKGAKNIYYRGLAITANQIKGGDRATFIYDGTQYVLVGVDRTDNLSINYSYNDSAATPNYITYDDTTVKITQLNYVVLGDVVTVSMNIKFTTAKTYSSNTKIFHGLASSRRNVFFESQGKCLYLAGSDVYIRGGTSVTADQTLWGINFTYIKA